MDNDLMNGLRSFDQVWSRVTKGTEAAKPSRGDDAQTLRELMEEETRDAAFYGKMAGRAGPAARTFRCMAADERAHRSALRLEYFLLTGDSYVTQPPVCPAPGGTLDALRAAHAAELESAGRYLAAAEETKSERLQELYRLHAADEQNHADALRCVLSRAIR